jgi:hypothetical protein
MRGRIYTIKSVSILVALVTPALAQSGGGYTIVKSTINSGGAKVSGGDYVLSGTVGQHDPGEVTGGDYSLQGGFWPGTASACVTCRLYADVSPIEGDCIVEVGDVLCILAGYAGSGCLHSDIAPCGGDGIIEVSDVLAVLAAYSDNYFCAHPCPP